MLASGFARRRGFNCKPINAPSFSAGNASDEQLSAASFAARASNRCEIAFDNSDRVTAELELPENQTPTLSRR